jgi:hypothetical protein
MLLSWGTTLLVLAVQAPVSEFRFPTEPIAPAAVGLGNTGVASHSDAEAALNPASLAGAHHLSLHRFDGYAGYNGFVLAGGVQLTKPLTVGLAFRHFDYGKLIEDDLGPGTQDLDVNEQAFTLTGAASLGRRIRLGAALTHLAADYFGSVTSATMVSLGGIMSYSQGGRVGLAIRSMGGDATNADAGTRYPVPTRFRIGATQEFIVAQRPLTLAFDTEIKSRHRAEPAFHGGAEWKPLPPLALRAGYENLANSDVAGNRIGRWSAGVGVQIGPAVLGIAARFGGEEGADELFLGLDAF